ncbi:MAG: hypothetical protein ABJP70_01835 [Erythrobacter sp.]
MTILTPARRAFVALTCPALLLSACAEPAGDPADDTASADANPQDAFFEALSSHCGKAYAGKLVSKDEADADFAEADMVMHVRLCSDEQIAVPFHVQVDGEWDRSRTWLITRTDDGLRLKHDHRHKDGEPDAVTMYGGDTAPGEGGAGTARAQSFPVDQFSIEMFEREDLAASVTNVWTVEVDAADVEDGTFAYQLKRTVAGGAPEDRLFRVEFDLTKEVTPPVVPWGWE